MSDVDYAKLATESRLKVLDLVYKAQTSHIGSLLGAADIFAVLFSKIDLDKDKFILSAGWKASLLYFHLWKLGRITLEELDSYCQEGSKFIGLAEPIHPDIPFAGGSMGYGLPAAVGFALAKKLNREDGIVYCYMSDGELAIGTTWEAMLIARHHKLDNLIVIVESNGLQAMGKTSEILRTPIPFRSEFVDGHKFDELDQVLSKGWFRLTIDYPYIIDVHTTKGKGVPKWENNNLWHYAQVKEDDYNYALSCLKS